VELHLLIIGGLAAEYLPEHQAQSVHVGGLGIDVSLEDLPPPVRSRLEEARGTSGAIQFTKIASGSSAYSAALWPSSRSANLAFS
jgi:hypothetical protein